MKRAGTAVFIVLLLVAIPATAFAQSQSPPPSPTYPPDIPPSIDVGPTDPDPGGQVTVSGRGWCPGSTVDIYLDVIDDAHYLGTATVGQDGTFTTKVTIPPNTPPGPHTILVSGLAYNCTDTRVMSRTIVVGGETEGGTLPFTGSSNLTWGLLVLVALVAIGAVTLVAGRRRGRLTEE